jgi:hypothetical protein
MYEDQKVHLFRPSLGFLVKAQAAVVLDISSSRCCCRLYVRSFSYYAPNKHIRFCRFGC